MSAQAMGASDPLRAYIITLRKLQGFSQGDAAALAGVARRTWIAWESGEIVDIKVSTARRAIEALGGSFSHLDLLGDDATVEEAISLAQKWLDLAPELRAELSDAGSKLARIAALSRENPDKLEQVIAELRLDARVDPQLLDLLTAFLAGRRSIRTPSAPRRGSRRRD